MNIFKEESILNTPGRVNNSQICINVVVYRENITFVITVHDENWCLLMSF